MPSDYEAITKHNERQLGLDTASRKTQICMYSDSSHFIYEILQNADDYGATEVFFRLSKDELLIEHNGEPFVEENVEAITYFGKSTSRDDLVKTGRFGVGFKSVFAFTATPTVISGDEHFQIYGLYRVREHPYPSGFSRSRTRIILPFNHESEQPDYVENLMSRKEAYSKISSRLTGLNMNTLLFTRNIREIRWEIDGRTGHYLREDETDGKARWTTITDGEQLNKYLVFSRIPKWRNQEYKAVEIAFSVDEKNQLSSVDDFLYVLFATTQETHLQFIINGPFRTNPSRETISEDDHFNTHLIKETCVLMKDVLPQLREMGLLTTQFLSVLPNGNDKLRAFYAPLLDTIVKTFHEQELVPTDDNQYASSGDVLQGPAPIREVITKKELPFFIGRNNACWAKGVQQNSRADHFLRGLDIQQWSWEQLQKSLDDKYGVHSYHADDDAWLAERPDLWLQKLYILLADAIRKGECSEWTLKRCRIVRVLESGKETHVAGTKAYFPKKGYRELPQVKRAILRGWNQQATNKIEESLIALGVSEIGDNERIDLLLETYYSEDSAEVTTQQHLQHMRSFIKWWKKDKDVTKFEDYTIFLATKNKGFHTPMECFIDSPLRKTGLQVIYSKDIPGIERKLKLWDGYRKLSSDGFYEFAVACGVDDQLSIEHRSCWSHPQWSEMREGLWGARETYTGKNSDYYIPELAGLLNCRKREISLLVWDTVRKANPKVLCAEYRPNQQYKTRVRKSSLVLQLSETEWIPDKRGRLHKPCDITKEKLHPDFKYDNRNGWLDEIGFGENAKRASEEYKKRKEMASNLGIPPDVLDEISKLPEEEQKKAWKDFNATIKQRQKAYKKAIQRESIPYHEALASAFSAPGRATSIESRGKEGTVQNPSRRRDRTSEDIAVAIENEGNIEQRFSFSLRKKWKGKNDQVRVALAEWYGGQCQICGKTFTQRSGEPYFEGLYLVPYTTAEWLDRVGNVLCVCPWHSAMFQFGSKEVDEDIIQQVMRLKVRAEGGDGHPKIRMKLCGKQIEIEFAENHLIDLQEMIRASRSTKPSGQQKCVDE